MTEKIVNLFLFIFDDEIKSVGARWRDAKGTDEEKIILLQDNLERDMKKCTRHKVPSKYMVVYDNGHWEKNALTYTSFRDLMTTSRKMEFLEDVVFRHYKFCPASPLMVLTPVVDGKIKIDECTSI